MRAGKRNTKVDCEQMTGTTRDAHGRVDRTSNASWESKGSRWAAVMPQNGREFDRAKQTNAELTHIVKMKPDSMTRTITSKWRLKIYGESRYLNVISVADISERNRELVLHCKEAA